jgi:hypothetical protein
MQAVARTLAMRAILERGFTALSHGQAATRAPGPGRGPPRPDDVSCIDEFADGLDAPTGGRPSRSWPHWPPTA